MSTDVPLRCTCGEIQGRALGVLPNARRRVICYCDDCQAFARFLWRNDITDEWGGTDIYPMPPSHVRITQGAEHLACMRLSAEGIFRWYCGECMTPLGNTVKGTVPFIGMICRCMDLESLGRTRDEVLGKPVARAMTKFANGRPPSDIPELSKLQSLSRGVKLVAKWWIGGAGSPSPFFDDRTHAPRAQPRVLTPMERDALR